jgi:hypothetical protein
MGWPVPGFSKGSGCSSCRRADCVPLRVGAGHSVKYSCWEILLVCVLIILFSGLIIYLQKGPCSNITVGQGPKSSCGTTQIDAKRPTPAAYNHMRSPDNGPSSRRTILSAQKRLSFRLRESISPQSAGAFPTLGALENILSQPTLFVAGFIAVVTMIADSKCVCHHKNPISHDKRMNPKRIIKGRSP